MNLKHLWYISFALLINIPTFCLAHTPVTSNPKIPTLAPMLANVTPTIVNIAVDKVLPNQLNPDNQNAKPQKNGEVFGVGSGVIIDAKQGLIVTNAHVIQNARIMVVTLKDGRRYRAGLVGQDPGFDIAIIKIPAQHLKNISFGDSDKLKVGDFVAAIGSPFGLTQTVTSGVISALNRSEPRIEGFQSFIQTDAPINPGNSGGALVNLQGQLIGINTAIVAPSYGNIGIGFSIPSNMVKSVLTQLLKYGKVKRGMLGVIAQNITPELASALGIRFTNQGAIVTKVIPDSAAEKAGIHVQDIIESLNEKPIHSAAQLRNTLGLKRPGTKITLHIMRNHKPLTITTTVGDPKKIQPAEATPFLDGIRLQDFHELETDGSKLNGVLVTGISDLSAGALAGLRPGDVITQANLKPVQGVGDLVKIAQSNLGQLLVKVARDNASVFLVIEKQQ